MGKRKTFFFNESLLFVFVSSSLFFSGIQAAVQHESDPSTEPASQERAKPPEFKFFIPGALAFGDLYAVPGHHLPEAEDKVGFWIRRIYLTGDFNLSKQIFVRARFEANQDGDFVSNAFTGDIKDLFLRWTLGRHKLFFGLSPTPTFDLVEDLWGFRYLEKTPLDLQGEPSRDWGIAARGPLSQRHQINYRIMLGSGYDLGRETGEGTKFMGAVSYGNPKKGWLIDLYGDFQKLPGPTDHTTGQISLHYSLAKGRVGGLYSYQDREADPRLEVASAYGVADLFTKVSLV